MGNTDLVRHILEACDEYNHNKISVAQLQTTVETIGISLEGVGNDIYSQLHDFSNELERIQFACLQEKQYSEACTVIDRLRKYLEILARRQQGVYWSQKADDRGAP